jgi:Domain of unknown function DUF29
MTSPAASGAARDASPRADACDQSSHAASPVACCNRRNTRRQCYAAGAEWSCTMASPVKTPPATSLYDDDTYAWAKQQADLLRARRFDDLDLENLILEVEDVGGSLKRSARSRIRRIIEHLLKLEHSPARDPRTGWYDTIITQRGDLQDELTPTVRREVEAALPELYRRACRDTATSLRKHREEAAADALPASCPYTFDQITGDWLP